MEWDDAAAHAELDTLSQSIRWSDPEVASPQGLLPVQRYVQLLFDLGMVEEGATAAGEWFRLLGLAILKYPTDDLLLDGLLRWATLSRRFDVAAVDELTAWDDFAAIQPLLIGKPGRWQAALLQQEVLLLAASARWQANGGRLANLPMEAQTELARLQALGIDHYRVQAQTWLDAGHAEEAAVLLRGLVLYAVSEAKPNEANAARKLLLAALPHTQGYEPVDRAEVLVELGVTLLQHGKKTPAQPYLVEAVQIYQDAGPAFELHLAQAESWLESAQ